VIHLHLKINERPVTWNTFYSGRHWSKRKALRDRWHMLALAAVMESGFDRQLPWAFVGVRMNIRGKRHVPDASNVWFKAIEDAIVERGILQDDSPEYVRAVIITVRTECDADSLEFVLADDTGDITRLFALNGDSG